MIVRTADRAGSRNGRVACYLLFIVGVADLVAHLLLFPPDRGPSWVEAIDVSR
jgi:hypothetical protein